MWTDRCDKYIMFSGAVNTRADKRENSHISMTSAETIEH